MKRQALWLTPLLLIAALGFWLARQPEYLSEGETVKSEEPATPRYTLTGASWLRLDSKGQPQLRAQAVQIDFFDDDSARLETLSVDALGGLDSVWRLSAPSGYVPPHQKRLRLDGPVNGETRLADNEWAQLHAEQLWVDQSRRELTSDKPVRLVSPRRQAQAHGLRADFNGKRIELRGNVEARYAPN